MYEGSKKKKKQQKQSQQTAVSLGSGSKQTAAVTANSGSKQTAAVTTSSVSKQTAVTSGNGSKQTAVTTAASKQPVSSGSFKFRGDYNCCFSTNAARRFRVVMSAVELFDETWNDVLLAVIHPT